MGKTSIEWCHHTFNCWRGCEKVSAGCDNCYAETMSRRNPNVLGIWGPDGKRVVAADSYWKQPLRWNQAAKEAGERHRVFCASLADVFEDWRGPVHESDGNELCICRSCGDFVLYVQAECRNKACREERLPARLTLDDVRKRLFSLIAATPYLDWQLLTKRPENVRRMVPQAWLEMWPANVWMGTSVENQEAADERIPHLLQVPAAVRFLSCEPLLGPITLMPTWTKTALPCPDGMPGCEVLHLGPPSPLSWIIVGGESGANARPMHPDWVRSLQRQCLEADVPFFFKQHGEWLPWSEMSDAMREAVHGEDGKHLKPHQMLLSNGDSGVGVSMYRVGKKAAGRLLDGREWNEFPRVEAAS